MPPTVSWSPAGSSVPVGFARATIGRAWLPFSGRITTSRVWTAAGSPASWAIAAPAVVSIDRASIMRMRVIG